MAGADQFRTLHPDEAEEAAVALARAFMWAESAEGHEYWQVVHARLKAIAAAGRAKAEQEPANAD